MRCYSKQHRYDCGIDLHAQTMSVCILDQSGELLPHRHMKTSPDALLKAMAPYRDPLVVVAAYMFTWS
jgi:predicted NBD/HSP70 family sugar kinase